MIERWHRRSLRIAALLIATATAQVLSPGMAHADDSTAYTFWVGHFAGSGNLLKWKDDTGAISYGNGALAGATSWSSATTHITLTEVTSGANIDVRLGQFGTNTESGQTNPSPVDSSGHWMTTVVWYFNTDNLSGSTPTQRKQVAVHEFGHALGLAHTNRNQCSLTQMMAGSNPGEPPPAYNMFTCNYQDPRAGDVNGVNHLY